jgi:hypothetical protein
MSVRHRSGRDSQSWERQRGDSHPCEGGSTRLIGSLPEHGIWTAVGLGRGQFFAILGLSIACFMLVGGPVWRHVHEGHLLRILVSYGIIPALTGLALYRNGVLSVSAVLAASAVVALVKLVATAGLLIAFALVQS